MRKYLFFLKRQHMFKVLIYHFKSSCYVFKEYPQSTYTREISPFYSVISCKEPIFHIITYPIQSACLRLDVVQKISKLREQFVALCAKRMTRWAQDNIESNKKAKNLLNSRLFWLISVTKNGFMITIGMFTSNTYMNMASL